MKLDYDLIRQLLKFIEDTSDGQRAVFITPNSMLDQYDQIQIDYHLKILLDQELIIVDDYIDGVPGTIAINRQTSEGHKVLEVMENDTLWNNIKDVVLNAGIEGLKQMPSLAIQILLKQ